MLRLPRWLRTGARARYAASPAGAAPSSRARYAASLAGGAPRPARPLRCLFGRGRVARSLRRLARQARRRQLDRLDDELVARAAAEVARDRPLDLVAARPRLPLQEIQRRHQHPRRTVAALQRVRLVEGLLQRVQTYPPGPPPYQGRGRECRAHPTRLP